MTIKNKSVTRRRSDTLYDHVIRAYHTTRPGGGRTDVPERARARRYDDRKNCRSDGARTFISC